MDKNIIQQQKSNILEYQRQMVIFKIIKRPIGMAT